MKTAPLSSQRFPFAGIFFAAVAGILLSSWLGAGWWLAAALLAALVLLFPVRKQGGLCWALVLTAFALLQLWNWQESPARKFAGWLDGHPLDFQIQGVVSGEPKISSSGSATFPVRVERISPIGNSGEIEAPMTVPVLMQVRWSGVTPEYGDRVLFHASAARPAPPRNPGAMDYRGWLERHGIHTQLTVDPSEPGTIISPDHGNPVIAWAIAARHRMEKILGADLQSAPDVLSAIKGITLGVTENAPDGFTDDFRFTGTMHLFSVSGLHVGMLAVIIWFVLKAARLPRSWAVAFSIPALFFYVAVTGLKAGSIRSATMASLLLIGMVLFRRSPMLNTLAAAAFLQLAFDTNVLFSAGWQFSYAVVFAILVGAAPIEGWLRSRHAPDPFLPPRLLTRRERLGFGAWNHLSGLAAVSAAAWIGSLIPTIAYFHLISLSAFGANLLAVPLAFGVLSLGMLSLLGGSFSLWIAGAFNNANWLVTKLLLSVVQISALLPGGHWFIGTPGSAYPVMTILDLRGASCAVIRRGNEFALINASRKRDAFGTVLPFLEFSGANSLRNVLITKSDAAHLGGIPLIGQELAVGKTGAPTREGRSPVAKALFSSRCPPERLHAGVVWPLVSGVSAQILDPAQGVVCDTLVARIMLGPIRVLMLPMLDARALARLSAIPGGSLRAEVVVLPLGGSEIASTLGVIRRIAPEVVISSVDPLNRNGAPSREWNRILTDEGITLLRQDDEGALILQADPVKPSVRSFLHPDHTIPLAGATPVSTGR